MGISSVHQFITRSDFEKNRWPPMSMRLPLWRIVQEMPPMRFVASSTTGRTSERRRSSSAAVRPAGPAPMMMALFIGQPSGGLQRREVPSSYYVRLRRSPVSPELRRHGMPELRRASVKAFGPAQLCTVVAWAFSAELEVAVAPDRVSQPRRLRSHQIRYPATAAAINSAAAVPQAPKISLPIPKRQP